MFLSMSSRFKIDSILNTFPFFKMSGHYETSYITLKSADWPSYSKFLAKSLGLTDDEVNNMIFTNDWNLLEFSNNDTFIKLYYTNDYGTINLRYFKSRGIKDPKSLGEYQTFLNF
jgi:hypothetical protein